MSVVMTASLTRNLSSLPQDILFHILSFQSLADNVTFSLVCRAFNALSYKRSLWIRALNRERLVRPLACTSYEDLTKLDLDHLKRIAFHTLRLQHNWSRPRPRVVGPIKAVTLGAEVRSFDLIFQVPATELYVFHSRLTGEVTTWDAGLGKQVVPPQFLSMRVMDVSPGQEENGKFWMGLLTSESPHTFTNNKIIVIFLEYGPAGVNLSIPFSYQLKVGLSHWAIFMTKDYIGVLECAPSFQDADELEYVSVLSFNLLSGRQTVITTDMPGKDFAHAHSGTSTADGELFILLEDKGNTRITHIPKLYLPHDGNPDSLTASTLKWRENARELSWETDPDVELIPEGALSANDFYRTPAVSLHASAVRPGLLDPHNGPNAIRNMTVRFWGAPDSLIQPYLSLQGTITIPGHLKDSPDSSWKLMLLSHSGRNMLMVMEQDTYTELRLVNLHPETNSCTSHHLVVPPFIQLPYVYGLSMDAHLGVITLLDSRGYLFAIPYA